MIVEATIFADYFQFYVADENYQTNTGEIWNEDASDRMLAVGCDIIAVGTARNMDVPVLLELHDCEPANDLEIWEQVIECSLDIPSGKIIIMGPTDYIPEMPRNCVAAGHYRARVSYRGLDDLSEDGLEGNDAYRVQLWPGTRRELGVLKNRPR